MSKPAAATVKRATADWAKEFPNFDVFRSLVLLRRVGPVLQGITLDRTSSGDRYEPVCHVHALTREFPPVLTLTLRQQLAGPNGYGMQIAFADHDTALADAARLLERQSALPLQDWPTIPQIVDVYRQFALNRLEKGLAPAVIEVEDSVLIPAVAGIEDSVADSLRLARELATAWPTSRLPPTWKGSEAWLEDLERRSRDTARLAEIVDQQIAFHKVSKIRTI
ncbi:hypothetical protein BJY16_007382 [Actinoplanes octamycinicus]|uniref:Uncharacterized protein n=1 Tax=Actinoplanes octamycinicus TaxID=135948 RepID=A0A7W7H4M8_9ACTN|nr:hypothetical protein [Actinoplanes octamycinicus]MBB4743923.1 hypothetical protein [Actinoplanes octamycinicus]GIE58549.1 hypothetical protein Aoc01nite_39510 [Actinoplanes octamycinicus]